MKRMKNCLKNYELGILIFGWAMQAAILGIGVLAYLVAKG